MERSVPIRSVSRSIAVLQAINRGGSLSAMEVARAVALPYPTAFRIIQTLLHEGLVEFEATGKQYRVTELVQTLALGYSAPGRLLQAARPRMVALTEKVAWPVSLATHVGRSMMVRDSTHTLSSLTFCNYAPGFTLPLLECASGHAYLAHVSDSERATLLAGLEAFDRRSQLLEMFKCGRLVQNIRDNGYATWERNPHSQFPGKTSSIAAPVFQDGVVVAALTLVFFSSAMAMAEALRRYLGDVRATARSVSEQLNRMPAEPAMDARHRQPATA